MEKVCSQCGAPIEEGATRCKYCRTLLTQEEIRPTRPEGPVKIEAASTPVTPVRTGGTAPAGVTHERNYQVSAQDDAKDHKIHAILAYIGILVVVPLFGARDSEFARFHANQGLVLFIANIALSIISVMIGNLPLVGMVFYVVRIGILVFIVMGIVSAVKGEKKELPLIGGVHLLK